MKSIQSLIACMLLMLSGSANAGVWYQWHATNDVTPLGITLSLEFDTAVVQSGAFQMNIAIQNNGPWLDTIFPQSGLLNFSYGTGTGGGIHYAPRQGISSPGPVILDMSVAFGPGNHLTGHIHAHNFDSQFRMATSGETGPNFTIYEAESDAGMRGCGWAAPGKLPCFGASGQIRRIPEPASIALLGLGALGIITVRRRTAQRKARDLSGRASGF
ncbi:PEP-CTERM sorting domain-containing protein [Massilia sp. H6]|uniref:PEP-CTERM sorting domain-containing protein n=1 Tax=Massilia sp. H6 TaxID=2970464 RepID=UPI002167D92B|nr:PEP-CTERM sorting domain-containing protein [Massilia sp. H6]UVW26919.1 PEP-CTERM sorting domain-containing protein [Massilia sp. H6]